MDGLSEYTLRVSQHRQAALCNITMSGVNGICRASPITGHFGFGAQHPVLRPRRLKTFITSVMRPRSTAFAKMLQLYSPSYSYFWSFLVWGRIVPLKILG